jgi:hypothetical protein
LWPGLMYVHSRTLTLRIVKNVQITNNSVSTSHNTNYFSITKTKVSIFLGELVVILLELTIIHFNFKAKSARFCNVESCAVLNQNVILKPQTLSIVQRFPHFRTFNGIYFAVSGWC